MKRALLVSTLLALAFLVATSAVMAQDASGYTVPTNAETYTVPVMIEGATAMLTITVKGSSILSINSEEEVQVGKVQHVELSPANISMLTSTLTVQVNVPEFPVGADGEVDVVHIGPYYYTDSLGDTTAGIVIRNNTDETIYNVSLAAEAFDADGNLLGFSSEYYDIYPLTVEPGQISAGELYFEGVEVLESDVIAVEIEYRDKYDPYRWYPLQVSGVTHSRGSKESLVGTISNLNNVPVRVYEIMLLCFYGKLGNTYTERGELNTDVLQPGESAAFQVVSDCESYILSASGPED